MRDDHERKSFPCLALGALMAAFALSACDGEAQQAQAQPAPPPPEVAVESVRSEDVALTYEYAGRVTGMREVEVRARVGGILLERTYEEGAVVAQGDLLFRIDPEPYAVALARAEAQLHEEQARLEQARRDWRRILPLYERKTISARERDEAQSAVELAEASVAAAEANVRAARIDLDYTRVTAPVSGVTSLETRSEGSLVVAGTDDSLLTRITQMDPVYVRFALPDAEAASQRALIESGRAVLPQDGRLTVEIRLGDGSVHAEEGHVDFTDSSIDLETGTIQARAVVPNPEKSLLPGQFVRVVVKGVTLKDAITVPQPAVMQGPQGTFVYVVDAESQAQARPVTLGRGVGGDWVIEQGLAPGDRIVVEGVIKTRPGQAVRIARTDERPAELADAGR